MRKNEIQLNKEQQEAAVHSNGPLLIVAGAGTGKTALITARIARLIKEGLAKSDEILALTFTEKAAGEMEERVDKLLPLGYFDLNISTFHSFGEKLLRQSGFDIGLPADFKLFNEFEQYSLVKKNLDRLNLNYYRPMGNPTKFIRALLSHFSRLKDEDVSPEDYLLYAEELKQDLDGMLSGGVGKKKTGKRDTGTDSFLNAEGEFDPEVAEFEVTKINETANAYHIYQQLLLENGALDFGDLINYSLKLFRERPNILEKYRARFKYILVDEFQDTNWAQYELVKLIAAPHNNIVVVGDDDQAIFRFRGASMTNIMQFRKDYPKAKKIFLKENYRNSQNILDLAYRFIKLNNPNRLEYQFKEDKTTDEELNKELQANTKEEGSIELISGADSADEIARVINRIAELKIKDKEAVWGDFAILARANDHAREVCSFLEEARFPYLLYSSRGLYGKDVILNSINYLRALVDYYNNASLFKVLNLPMWDFTFEDLVGFNYLSSKKAWSIFQILENTRALGIANDKQERIDKFLAKFKKHANEARKNNTSDVFLNFINETGYLSYLKSLNEKESVEAFNYLEQFMKRIKAFEKDADNKTVGAFLDELEAEIDAGESGALPIDIDSSPDSIKVMTIHASKGLEFKYVFIISMVDKRFPTTEKKELIAIPDALLKEPLPKGDHHLEEERRLFYVGLTRARRGVFLSWARDCGGKREKKPSRFLIETELLKDTTIADYDKDLKGKKEVDFLKKKEDKQPEDFVPLMPKVFSYTQLAAFENCPYQYRFAHILKIPVRGKPSFSFGKTMHSALQKIFERVALGADSSQGSLFGEATDKKNDISLEECYKLYEESWVDDWYPSEKLKEEYRKKGKNIIKDFYEKHKDNWPKTLMLERGFTIKVKADDENFTVRGQIDRIDEMDDKIYLVDYKTGAPKDKLGFSEKEQLFIYQLASAELFRQPVGGLKFYYLDNNSEVEFLGSEKDLEKIENKISLQISEIRKGKFPANPGPLCKFCDFKDICEFKK